MSQALQKCKTGGDLSSQPHQTWVSQAHSTAFPQDQPYKSLTRFRSWHLCDMWEACCMYHRSSYLTFTSPLPSDTWMSMGKKKSQNSKPTSWSIVNLLTASTVILVPAPEDLVWEHKLKQTTTENKSSPTIVIGYFCTVNSEGSWAPPR